MRNQFENPNNLKPPRISGMDFLKRAGAVALLVFSQFSGCKPLTSPQPFLPTETPPSPTFTLEPTPELTPQPETPTHQPTPTAEPTSTPTSTSTPEPTSTATPRPIETLLTKNELLTLGYLPDFREVKELTPVEFTIPYNGETRQGLGWRIGGIELIFDQKYVDLEADFALGGHKAAGEALIPNLNYPNGPEIINQAAEVIHAFNLGVIPWESLPDDWQQRYHDFLAENPEASYPISGDVPVPGQPGTFVLKELGRVNPRLPIRVFILPPLMEKTEAWKRVDRIYGGDPRAPFHLPYSNATEGYFGVYVDEKGGLNVYFSDFNFAGKLLSNKNSIRVHLLTSTIRVLSPYNRSTISSLSLPKGPDKFKQSLYENEEVSSWFSP